MGAIARYGLGLILATAAAAGPCAAQESAPVVLPRPVAAQDPPKVVPQVLGRATMENTSLTVSLGRQRACLLVDGVVAIDTPVSTGKRRGLTPAGDYTIAEKLNEHRSNLYGDFVDREGRPVRSGVSTRIDAAPSGTVFRIVPVQYFMRLAPNGVVLHAGRLPGYAAADGAVRLPPDIAPLIHERVKPGTPVKIGD